MSAWQYYPNLLFFYNVKPVLFPGETHHYREKRLLVYLRRRRSSKNILAFEKLATNKCPNNRTSVMRICRKGTLMTTEFHLNEMLLQKARLCQKSALTLFVGFWREWPSINSWFFFLTSWQERNLKMWRTCQWTLCYFKGGKQCDLLTTLVLLESSPDSTKILIYPGSLGLFPSCLNDIILERKERKWY